MSAARETSFLRAANSKGEIHMLDDLFNTIFGKMFHDKHKDRECATHHNSTATGNACRPGYVYILQFGDVYKIGATNGNKGVASVKSRIAAVNKQMKQKGRLVGYIETNCAQGFERWLHWEYRSVCVRTEFFRLSETQLQSIRTMDLFNGALLRFFSDFS